MAITDKERIDIYKHLLTVYAAYIVTTAGGMSTLLLSIKEWNFITISILSIVLFVLFAFSIEFLKSTFALFKYLKK